jgi:hypothetical protein
MTGAYVYIAKTSDSNIFRIGVSAKSMMESLRKKGDIVCEREMKSKKSALECKDIIGNKMRNVFGEKEVDCFPAEEDQAKLVFEEWFNTGNIVNEGVVPYITKLDKIMHIVVTEVNKHNLTLFWGISEAVFAHIEAFPPEMIEKEECNMIIEFLRKVMDIRLRAKCKEITRL